MLARVTSPPPPDAAPALQEHEIEIEALARDVDELGHVSNIVYVRWIQEVATDHSRAVGWDHAAYMRLGQVFVVRRHEVDYLAPAYGGDRLRLTTWVARFKAATCERRTRITRVADGRAIVEAKTLWALVSAATGRPCRIPSELCDAFRVAPA
jgi:acyl-CoA thioester hydrolase